MKRKFYIPTILLSLAIAAAGAMAGCDPKLPLAEGAPENGNENPAILSIDSPIDIQMAEQLTAPPPIPLLFYCSTQKTYPSPYLMVVDQKRSADDIDISFLGVNTEGFYPAIPGAAWMTVGLGALGNGTYNLNLSNGTVKRTGKLTVSSDSYRIDFEENPDFHFTNTSLNKSEITLP